MTDEERKQIERDAEGRANMINRLANVEKDLSELKAMMAWGVRAIWGGAAYLLMELWKFLSQGGSLK